MLYSRPKQGSFNSTRNVMLEKFRRSCRIRYSPYYELKGFHICIRALSINPCYSEIYSLGKDNRI